MSVLVLDHAAVVSLLPMEACVDVMADALAALARGEAHQPLRTVVRPPGAAGVIALMPAYASRGPHFGLKSIGIFPGNVALGRDSHQGAVLLYDGATGELLALMNAAAITALRTAAVSAVATRLLARPDAGDLAIVGAGVQARSHLDAMRCVRSLRRVRVACRSRERAAAFVRDAAGRGVAVEACDTVEDAVRGADLIVTATSSAEPVVRREWIASGAHLNVVGASVPACREVDSATMAAARLFVDRRESTLNESGDYLVPAREGLVGPDHIRAEIGELLVAGRPGRASDAEITLFKSLGLAIEDLAAARHVYEAARRRGLGTTVSL